MNTDEMKARTRRFAVAVIRCASALPTTLVVGILGKQLVRAGTSVGANYRAACRAKSPADFIAKMGIVEEEADETIYWLELLLEAGILPAADCADLLQEANELVAITVASIKTARGGTR